MAETITPEQQAKLIMNSIVLHARLGGWRAHGERFIASAIRAAVEAERERCAAVADDMAEASKLEFGALSGQAIGAAAVALHLRAFGTLITEPSHDR